jgi:hypothetical protein
VELRHTVANAFRNPADLDASQKPWPWIYGDAMAIPMPPIPRAMAALTPTQLALLQYWADGQFVADYDPEAVSPQRLEQLPLAEQPAMLDRAALEFCLADAFHPGCEMTWPVRHSTTYQEPYRYTHLPAFTDDQDRCTRICADHNGWCYSVRRPRGRRRCMGARLAVQRSTWRPWRPSMASMPWAIPPSPLIQLLRQRY